MRNLLFLVLIFYAPFLSGQVWLVDIEEALKSATNQEKMILLNFSGSDWCIPCIKMKKEIFSQPDFKEFANDKLVLLQADFPRRKKNQLSAAQRFYNEQLARRYNPEGNFPMTILLNRQGEVLKSWNGLPAGSSADFIQAIKTHLATVPLIPLKAFDRTFSLMGSRFDITVVGPSEEWAASRIDSAVREIQRIEALISTWKPNSEASGINDQAGIRPVKVSRELFNLIRRAKKVSRLTEGAFDITFGGLDPKIWKFDGSLNQLPDSATAARSIHLINYNNILLDENALTVMLKEAGMRIGFGAIGKGYAAEKAKSVLLKLGVESGIINAGGDLLAWGEQADGQKWTIGLADPRGATTAFSWLEIKNQAVVTSGNYEKYVYIDGKKYSHIVDPRTGFPVSGLQSVTVICASAELADALATAVYVMGKSKGLALINELNYVECIIVDEHNKLVTSNGIEIK